MRKMLTAFAAAALFVCCGVQNASASGAQGGAHPLAVLKQEVAEVALSEEAAEKNRALLLQSIEKVSVAAGEGDFCEALKSLEVFKFHVSRFSRLGFMKDPAGGRELTSLADRTARRFRERADRFGIDCPPPR